MKIIFFGTPPFAAAVLDTLIGQGINVVAVVTKPDKPKGRSGAPTPTAVKALVQSKYPHLPLHQPAIISALDEAATLQAYDADLFVVVAFGEIIKQHLLDMPKRGCINVHTSLLPKYRGAAPIQQAIIHGEEASGATIMYMVKKMDAGDIIKQVVVPIGPQITFGAYEEQLLEAGSAALLAVIEAMHTAPPSHTPQDHTQATLAPKIELEDCEIDWSKPAQDLHNLVRGVNPYPGAWCEVWVKGKKKRLKIWETRVVPSTGEKPGELVPSAKGELIIAAAKDALQIVELQLEGKKPMRAEELLRGLPKSSLAFIQ